VSQGGLRSPPFSPTLHSDQTNLMTFVHALLSAGYLLDEENFDENCYIKTDSLGFVHIYQMGEDEGEWNYVKMTEDYDVITEVTFNPDSNTVIHK